LRVTPAFQAVANGIDVVDLEGEVAKIAGFAVVLGVPIVGEFEQRGGAAAMLVIAGGPYSCETLV
jgi:hypothetical protein